MPKFFDLCLDDIALVREETSLVATASILRNLAGSKDGLAYAIGRMKSLNESPSFVNR